MQEVIDGSADYDDRRQLADVRPRGCDRGAEHVRRDFELEREREPSLLERLETTLSVQAVLGPQEALRCAGARLTSAEATDRALRVI